jgi:hypothetical protein
VLLVSAGAPVQGSFAPNRHFVLAGIRQRLPGPMDRSWEVRVGFVRCGDATPVIDVFVVP